MFCQFYVNFPKETELEARPNGHNGDATSTPNGNTEDSTRQNNGTTTTKKPRGVLSCQLYQRSCDMGLGVPFNIASYALLTHMLASVCGLTPGTFIHTMGDAHVYMDHVDALKVQLKREPREFPELRILREHGNSIDGWKADEFEVVGYKPHASIAMKMSV